MRLTPMQLAVPFALAFLVAPLFSQAQQPTTVHRIGLLRTGSALAEHPFLESVRQGLRDLGYVEGQNLVIEQRYAEGSDERLRRLARVWAWAAQSDGGGPGPGPAPACCGDPSC